MHHAYLENLKRCFVLLYKLYNSRCPPERPSNSFYLQQLKNPSTDLWYSTTPVGHATLEKQLVECAKVLEWWDTILTTHVELLLQPDCTNMMWMNNKK